MKNIKQKKYWDSKIISEAGLKNTEENNVTDNPVEFKKNVENLKKKKSSTHVLINTRTKQMLLYLSVVRKGKLVASEFLEPTLMYINQSITSYNNSVNYLNSCNIKIHNEEVDLLEENQFSLFLQNKTASIILLHAAVESFLNKLIPDGEHLIDEKALTKEDIERNFKFKEKLRFISNINEINFNISNQNDIKLYNELLNFNTIRNDLIHLKYFKAPNNMDNTVDKFADAVRMDYEIISNNIFKFMNQITPQFIEFD